MPLSKKMRNLQHIANIKTYGKYACIGLAITLLVGLFLMPLLQLTPNKMTFKQLPSIIKTPSISGKSVIHPVLQGMDKQNQFFNITAKHLTHISEEQILLEYPSARLEQHGNKFMTVTAMHGDVMLSEQYIILKGNVQIDNSNDEHMQTESATIYLQEDRMATDQPVHIRSPQFDLIAEGGMELHNGGMQVSFKGRVKVLLSN